MPQGPDFNICCLSAVFRRTRLLRWRYEIGIKDIGCDGLGRQ
jgi:hypothetical protein